jgi:hypothetical protein
MKYGPVDQWNAPTPIVLIAAIVGLAGAALPIVAIFYMGLS